MVTKFVDDTKVFTGVGLRTNCSGLQTVRRNDSRDEIRKAAKVVIHERWEKCSHLYTYSSQLARSTSVVTHGALKMPAGSRRRKSNARNGDAYEAVNLLWVGVEQSVQFWSPHSQKDVGNWKKPREGRRDDQRSGVTPG